MIRKINKKVAFTASIIISTFFGFLFTYTRGTTVNVSELVLETPIFSIEKASAYDGGGDCSGSSNCETITYPTPASAGVGVIFSAP